MIYFPNGEEAKSLNELLTIGFDDNKFQRTYYDKDFEKSQCHRANRSFDDLYEIATTYFPNTTLEELAHVLTTHDNLRALYCPNINRLVFDAGRRGLPSMHRCHEGIYGDRFKEDPTGISYNKLLKMAEEYINSKEQVPVTL